MDKKIPPPFSAFPDTAKKGIVFLLLGWICHFYFIYSFFSAADTGFETQMLLQQSAIALLVCFFTIRVRNWARVLCVVSNLLIITLYILFFTLFFQTKIVFSTNAAINVILFSISTVFLLLRETSDFYKLHSPSWGGNKSEQEKKDVKP